MYTDERFCAVCCEYGLFKDGENYCTQCKNYLCLMCTQSHGQKCRNKRYDLDAKLEKKICTGIQQRLNGNALKKHHDRYEKVQNMSMHERDVCHSFLDNAELKTGNKFMKTANSFDSTPNNIHSAIEKDEATVSFRKDTPNHDENKTMLRQSSKGKRENYSARGGIVRVHKSTASTEKIKHQRCCNHPETTIENFCSTHNALCCEECLNTDHTRCTVQPIDEIAHGIMARGEVEKTENMCQILKKSLKEVKIKFENEKDKFYSGGKMMDTQHNTELSKKEIETTVLSLLAKNGTSELSKKIAKCKQLEENTLLCLSDILNAKESGNEIYIFVTLHKVQKTLTSTKVQLEALHKAETLKANTTGGAKDSQTSTAGDINGNKTKEKNLNRTKTFYEKDNTAKTVNTRTYRNEHEQALSNKTVIGDVVLRISDNCETEQDLQEKPRESSLKSDTESVCSYFHEDVKEDLETKNKSVVKSHMYEEINDNNNATNPSQQSRKLHIDAKYVAFSRRRLTSNMFRKSLKDRVKSNGLVTEYYMKENDEDNDVTDGFRILRLKSAPPERHLERSREALKRNETVSGLESYEMVQWQNKKILESVEHRKEALNEMRSKPLRSITDGARTPRGKKIFEFSDKETANRIKTEQQNQRTKHKLLRKSRKDNARKPHKKSILLKTRPSESTLKAMVKNYESRTEAERLQEWIKQTDEMNKTFENDRAKLLLKTSRSNRQAFDEVDEVYAANVHIELSECYDDYDEQPVVMLRTKEATIIKTVNPDDRQFSAKSRTSDSEEFLYNNQTYALRPKTQLYLTAEQIVRLPEDDQMCEINGISCMPDGRIVVSDYSNKSIKMFRVGWGKASVLPLDEPPHGVAVVSNSILAVISGLAYDRLLIINVGQNLAVKKQFKTDCVCKAISSYESHIYLLCVYKYKAEVRILTIDGIVSIRLDLGHAIPSPQSLAVKASNGLIYVVDKYRGIVCVEMGKIVSRSFDKNIESYLGIEEDINNNVFVCTKHPCGIYELSSDGKHMMPILLLYGEENIKAIAFNTANNNLIVGCENSETILIYKINPTLNLK